jgi:Fe-S cluster assembly ATP-binding protein
VHVLSEGRLVKSGGRELALELEEKGYVWLEQAAAASSDGTDRTDRTLAAGAKGVR